MWERRTTAMLGKPAYRTYHYGDDGVKDHGWGCSYRNAQTVASAMGLPVPSMEQMLGCFGLKANVRPKRRLWIEPKQVGAMLEMLNANIRCTHVVFSSKGLRTFSKRFLRTSLDEYTPEEQIDKDGAELVRRLDAHFARSNGLPAIIDDGIYSYILIPGKAPGAYRVVDPHVGRKRPLRCMKASDLARAPGWMILLPSSTKKDFVK